MKPMSFEYVRSYRIFPFLALTETVRVTILSFDCLLIAMSVNQDDDGNAAFVFVGEFNAHHREWLESVSPADSNGRVALDFPNLYGFSQLVADPTYLVGNHLDLVPTDVPDIVKMITMAALVTSDHSAISIQLDLR